MGDWSSDVCSSDLASAIFAPSSAAAEAITEERTGCDAVADNAAEADKDDVAGADTTAEDAFALDAVCTVIGTTPSAFTTAASGIACADEVADATSALG